MGLDKSTIVIIPNINSYKESVNVEHNKENDIDCQSSQSLHIDMFTFVSK